MCVYIFVMSAILLSERCPKHYPIAKTLRYISPDSTPMHAPSREKNTPHPADVNTQYAHMPKKMMLSSNQNRFTAPSP